MKTKLEVLYTHRRLFGPNDDPPESAQTPVVRYSDACAAISKLEDELDRTEQLRANAVARCEFLLAELHKAEARSQLTVHAGENCGHTLPRWDGPAKVL